MAKRDNPLFFKQDGGLDISQFLLVLITTYVLVIFVLAGLGILKVSVAAWSFLGTFVTICFIAWAARDRAALIAGSRSIGEVAKGIASAPAEPNVFLDDERDGGVPEQVEDAKWTP